MYPAWHLCAFQTQVQMRSVQVQPPQTLGLCEYNSSFSTDRYKCWVQGGTAEAQRDLWPEGKVQALSHEELSSLASSESREQDTLVALYAPWCQYSQVLSTCSACQLPHKEYWQFHAVLIALGFSCLCPQLPCASRRRSLHLQLICLSYVCSPDGP